MLAGALFHLLVARGLLDDLEDELMQPPAEHVHWMFATGFLLLGLFLLAEAIVGEEVWRRRPLAAVPLAVVRAS